MKMFSFIFLLAASSISASAQQTMFIANGTMIKTTEGVPMVFDNTGIVNNGNLQQQKGEGKIVFTGDENITITGSSKTTLDNVIVDKAPARLIYLKNELAVGTAIEFKSGVIDVGNSVVDLGTDATLINESEGSKLFASGSGYVKAVKLFTPAMEANPGNLGAILSSPESMGQTTIKRGNESFYNTTGKSSLRYYEITPENNSNLSASMLFKYFDGELVGIKESEVSMFKSAGGTRSMKEMTDAISAGILFQEIALMALEK